MRRFHIVVVTPDLRQTLAIVTSEGWLLPWLDDNPQVELPVQLESILRPIVGSIDMVHEAPIPVGSSGHVEQRYCLVMAPGDSISKAASFIPNVELSAKHAVLPLQRQAWSVAIDRLLAPTADFDSNSCVAAAIDWAKSQVASRLNARVLSVTRHRCSRYEYVVRMETTQGFMYFKGGLERVADEGVLTALLYAMAPGCVPEPLVIDVRQGRWIYRELSGALLIGPCLTLSAAADVIPALAALQKRAMGDPAVHQHLARRSLTARDLCEAVDREIETACDQEGNARQNTIATNSLRDDWRLHRDTILERCRILDGLDLPCSMVLSDFWPRNILMISRGVGFIDLERCYWSYPFLSLWRFAREVERILQTGGTARARIESAFVTAWADIMAPSEMTRAMLEMPLLGRLFELLLASRELDVRERDLGSQLPPGYRSAVLSRHLRPLLEDVCAASPSPSQAGGTR